MEADGSVLLEPVLAVTNTCFESANPNNTNMLAILKQRELGMHFPEVTGLKKVSSPSSSAGGSSRREVSSKNLGSFIDLTPHPFLGGKTFKRTQTIMVSKKVISKIDTMFNSMVNTIDELTRAMDSGKISEVEGAVQLVMKRLLHANTPNIDDVYTVTPLKKEEREVFVALGGLHQMLRFFEKPFGDKGKGFSYMLKDRDYKWWLKYQSHVWSDVLVILREVLFSLPSLSESVFSAQHICFLFMLLGHECTFEHAINLLEEILAAKTELFSLECVPNFHYLLDKLNVRQMAHFCKILSLVLFEPEDRAMIEGSQVLRGVELLTLRRDRLLKPNSIVERNQSIIVEAPQILEKMVQVLRVVNYGPDVGQIIKHDIISLSRSPVPSDLLKLNNCKFTDYNKLEEAAEEELGSDLNTTSDDADDPPMLIEDDITKRLLEAFAPATGMDGNVGRMNEVTTITNVMKMALSMGLATVTSSGQQLLLYAASAQGDNMSDLQTLILEMSSGIPSGGQRTSATHELQFHALLLAPYQIDVLFVLCTLLTGRRKIDIQGMFSGKKLAPVLLKMCERMSWFESPPPFDHPHSPGCECNPASALRVQYLRLVHNFFDSDFLFASNKKLLLSSAERKIMRTKSGRDILESADNATKGLINQLAMIHQSDKVELPYKFWLSLCLEAFVRGSTGPEQMMLTRSGMISSAIGIIRSFSTGQVLLQGLQSAFDLLGELLRRNPLCIAVLNASLDDNQFTQFMDVVVSNLVQSNVFITSMYISLEVLDVKARHTKIDVDGEVAKDKLATKNTLQKEEENEVSSKSEEPLTHYGYLTHSWFRFAPKPLSRRAIACTKGQEASSAMHKPRVYVDSNLVSAGKSLHGTKVVYPKSILLTGTRVPPPAVVKKWDGLTDPSELDDSPDEDSCFGTPPEAPSFLAKRAVAKAVQRSTSKVLGLEHEGTAFLDTSSLTKTKMPELPMIQRGASTGWAENDEVFRIGVFLMEERDTILLRLIDAMTIRTINHENICCLNTTLTLLLLVHQRGQLAKTLTNIRRLADKRVASGQSMSSRTHAYWKGNCVPCEELSGGEKLMTNFRQLLWFWTEYYMRRGRDRLSLEFTTRIRFQYWRKLVSLLCQDNGSPVALLKSPCNIIRSPYLCSDGSGRAFGVVFTYVPHMPNEM